MLTIALAKGRTADDVMPLWTSALLPKPEGMDESRSLVFHASTVGLAGHADGVTGKSAGDAGNADGHSGFGESEDEAFRFLLAKPADVPTYVSFGVADIGIVGKDVVLESGREVYELLDLKKAECRLCVAGRPEHRGKPAHRVATKYPRLADQYFRSRGEAVEIIPLGGSIELAAVIGLADRIFDLVQTGSTLKANGLVIFDEVMDVSARLVANRSSYRTKRRLIDEISARLGESITAQAGV